MRTLLSAAAVAGLFALQAHAVTVLTGLNPQKQECRLTIEEWEHRPAGGEARSWYNLHARVRAGEQLAGNPSIDIARSFTPYALYGKNKENYDQISVEMSADDVLTPASIIRYNFQTWDEERGLVQTSCRLK